MEASAEEPYLSVSFELDPSVVYDLLEGRLAKEPSSGRVIPFEIRAFDPRLDDPLARMLELLDHTSDIAVLAPLIRREITWRPLQGPFAPLLRQLAGPDGNGARIARATGWIRENVTAPLRVSELAELVNMSVPSFHRREQVVECRSLGSLAEERTLPISAKRQLQREPPPMKERTKLVPSKAVADHDVSCRQPPRSPPTITRVELEISATLWRRRL